MGEFNCWVELVEVFNEMFKFVCCVSMKHTEMLRSDDELRHLMFTMEDDWVVCQLGVTFSTSNAKNTIRVEERMK